jgi:hypothetical protein
VYSSELGALKRLRRVPTDLVGATATA